MHSVVAKPDHPILVLKREVGMIPQRTILIAPQSFKGSATATQVSNAIAAGVRNGWFGDPPAIDIAPLADGGDGTLDVLIAAMNGKRESIKVRGPLAGMTVTADLGWIDDEYPTAIIEMAQAAGLSLLDSGQHDALHATTYGVGEMIRAALDLGAGRLLVTLGGSATTDGGAGMAQALGARLLGVDGQDLPPGGEALLQLVSIDTAELDKRLAEITVIGLTDVTNPLIGEEGAAATYGPQKGATEDDVELLDAALAHFAELIARDMGRTNITVMPGAGAAGGLGAGLLAFCGPNVRLDSGAETILRMVDIPQRLANAALVFTGEGRLDNQSIQGKLTGTVARYAQACGVPAVCVVGGLGEGYEAAYSLGISAIIVAADGPRTLDDARKHTEELISGAVERAIRGWLAVSHL
jgi:glycerate 2-kinase